MTDLKASSEKQPRGLVVAWAPHSPRGELLAEAFGLDLHTIHAVGRRRRHALLKYPIQAWRTWRLLTRERPRLVVVQNPPIFAPLVVYLYARLYGACFVIDAHTGALVLPLWRWSLPLHGFLSRRAVTTLVTNEHLKRMVEGWGAPVTVVPNIPTDYPQGNPYPMTDRFSIAVINSFSLDEPLEAIFQAIRRLPQVDFYITGDLARASRRQLASAPPNAHFTGFLPDEDYFGLLRSVQAVMVLTTYDHTMQRGACEALSLGQPVITSDWPVLRDYFTRGTLFVDNSPEAIEAAVRQMMAEHPRLRREMQALRAQRRAEWAAQKRRLWHLFHGGPTPVEGPPSQEQPAELQIQ
ncbi:MAG: glycosyltransferase [Chloroflexi bacterium]|nr:MAG: glycosyltransferase [Chloroflexota bacterium]